MGTSESPARWDHEYDVVVVGSGAGGMTAALCAQAQGLSVLMIEKANCYGGTSAVSGGGIWIPCNDQIPGLGLQDSFEEALTYMKHLTLGEVPESRITAYLRNAPKMVRYIADTFGVKVNAVGKYPDYFPDKPGGKNGGRSMEPQPFDASRLGDEFERLREPYKGTLVMGRVAMTQVDAHTLMCKAPGWILLTLKLMWNYWTDFGWRRRTRRDRRLTLGQGLVGSLRHAMLQKDIPLWLETGLDSLVEDGGRVAGILAVKQGKRLRIGARRGVIVATGGVESKQQMREQYLPGPTKAAWTAAPGCNQGDGIRAGRAIGAQLGFMNLTWGTPTVAVPGSSNAAGIFMERQLPGCVMVNGNGKRFVNEASPYTEIVYAMYADHQKSGSAVPCWLVFDARFRKAYPMGPMLPGNLQPDSKLPKDWLDKVYYRADTLGELAKKIGVNAGGLEASVIKMNEYARTGIDAEFGKGNNAFDRYYGDPTVKPNPCLAPINKAPYYAVRLDAGEIGTKGGLVTDEQARVLRDDGSVIAGLYAIGNCSAAVMGRTYAGPGATLGPAMTFGYVAARDIAESARSGASVGGSSRVAA
jgi:3-oxosteroid 1-dehydrogenase